MAAASLEFFNSVSGTLEIELSSPSSAMPGLENQVAAPDATIQSIRLVPEFFERDSETFRDLTNNELSSVALAAEWVVLRGQADIPIRHRSPDGSLFTVRDLLAAVEETERQTRGRSGWFDGVDVHHVFFEGIRLTHEHPNQEWTIDWGS